MDDETPLRSLITLGIIRKAHGVRGEASVETWTRSADRFLDLKEVFLQSPDSLQIQEVSIESVRLHGGRALVKFREVDSPEDLRRYYEWTVAIDERDAIKLGADEYFLHDLVGLRVIETGTGREVGTTESADEGASGALLSVRRPDGGVFDLPFAAAICLHIDLDRREMTVDLPEGLEHLDEVEAIEELDQRTIDPETEVAPHMPTRLRVDVVTIFPRMFEPLLAEGVLSRGLRSGALEVKVWDLRDFTTDKHRSTDDEAYGGGSGMVMLAEPFFRCLEEIQTSDPGQKPHVVMLSPQGRPFSQQNARQLAGRGWIVLLCGRYEGFDERIREALVQEEVSVGDFVVSGGELPAMLVLDAVSRMVAGVVGDRNSVEADSFYNGLLDYPHYTRPFEFRGMKVPEVLLSGHAENVRKWRKQESLRATRTKRPDLLETASLDDEARQMLESAGGEEKSDAK